MKIYRAVVLSGDAGRTYAWFPSKREAESHGRLMAKDGACTWYAEAVDITTTKTGLIAWLDLNFTTDNG